MRKKSHMELGNYLIRQYLSGLPGSHKTAFLFGCIQPDKNPITYLKGSIRYQWFRGHNYPNTHRFMKRISRRLEQKGRLHIWDYYTLGKLIHYTADAFTAPHNVSYKKSLSDHRLYEASLQAYFLPYLQRCPRLDIRIVPNIMEEIINRHNDYRSHASAIENDARFALEACCCVLTALLIPRLIP